MDEDKTPPSAQFVSLRTRRQSAERATNARKLSRERALENTQKSVKKKKQSGELKSARRLSKERTQSARKHKKSREQLDNTQKSFKKKAALMKKGGVLEYMEAEGDLGSESGLSKRASPEQKTQDESDLDEVAQTQRGSLEGLGSLLDKEGENSSGMGQVVDSTELMALANADLNRAHLKTFVGINNQIEPEKWSCRDWKDLAVLGAMMAVLLDPMQNMSMSWNSRHNGGFIYLLLYLLITTFCQLPLFQLYTHVGHYHQSGLLNAFALFGPIYKPLGYCALLTLTINQAHYMTRMSGYLTVAAFGEHNVTSSVSCVGTPNSCYDDNIEKEKCCYSLYDKWQCEMQEERPSWCANGRQISPNRISATKQYVSVATRNLNYKMRSAHLIVPAITVLFTVAASFIPTYIFLALTAIIGFVGLTLRLINGITYFALGDLLAGIQREWTMTIFRSESFGKPLSYLIAGCIWNGLSKFSLISLASLASPKKRLYVPVLIMHFVHVIVTLFNYFSELSVMGYLESSARSWKESSSLAGIGYELFCLGSLAEFSALNNVSGLYIFNKLMMVFLCIGPLCGLFIDVISATMTLKPPRWWLRFAGCCLVFAGICFVQTAIVVRGESNKYFTMLLVILQCILIILIVASTINLYGSNEYIVDVSALYPVTSIWQEFLGPTSPFYSWSLCYVVPGVLTFCSFNILLQFIGAYKEHPTTTTVYLSIFIPIFCVPFIVAFIVEAIILKRHHLPIWRAFLPTKGHKAYRRFFPKDDIMTNGTTKLSDETELQVEPTQESISEKATQSSDVSGRPGDSATEQNASTTEGGASQNPMMTTAERKTSERSTQASDIISPEWQNAKPSPDGNKISPERKKTLELKTATENSAPKRKKKSKTMDKTGSLRTASLKGKKSVDEGGKKKSQVSGPEAKKTSEPKKAGDQ